MGVKGVGATEVADGDFFSNAAVDRFLPGGNKSFCFSTIRTTKKVLKTGSFSGDFRDANGSKKSFEGLTGMDLYNKMVAFEPSEIQEYITSYTESDVGEIMT